MAVRLLLMSDTHVPRRARALPEELLARVPEADAVLHAGDWVDTGTLDLLAARARRLIAVYGNNDGPALRAPAGGGVRRAGRRTLRRRPRDGPRA